LARFSRSRLLIGEWINRYGNFWVGPISDLAVFPSALIVPAICST